MRPRQAITVDIDSCLADTRHRHHALNGEHTDWTAYAKLCGGDLPTPVIELVRALHPHYAIILVSSRPIATLAETETWLSEYDVPYDELILDDLGLEPIDFKLAAVERIAYDYDVVLHLDDWWGVAQALQKHLGIPTVTVRVYAPDEAMTK